MRAKKCDLCGNFYEQHEDENQTFKLTEITKTASAYSKKVDLCLKCHSELANWILQQRAKADK